MSDAIRASRVPRALVDDVRVVHDQDVRAAALDVLAVPQRGRDIPGRQDRGVGWQRREDRLHEGRTGPVAAPIRGGQVAGAEEHDEPERDRTDDRPGIRPPGPRPSPHQHVGQGVGSDRRRDGQEQPGHQQVVFEAEVVRPDVDPHDEQGDAGLSPKAGRRPTSAGSPASPSSGRSGVALSPRSPATAGSAAANSPGPFDEKKSNWPRNCSPLTSHRTAWRVWGWL